MKNKIKYLSLFSVWGILLSINIFFAAVLYKEATRFPVELVGPARRRDAILAVSIITAVVFLACIVWFFVWKSIWKNQDAFESLLTEEEKNLSLNFSIYSLPLLLRDNILIINRGFSLERLDINSVIWIHTHKIIQRYRNSLMVYLYKIDGKKVKILLEYNKIHLFEGLLRKILSNSPQIKVSKGFLSKEYKKQKEWYRDTVRYN